MLKESFLKRGEKNNEKNKNKFEKNSNIYGGTIFFFHPKRSIKKMNEV